MILWKNKILLEESIVKMVAWSFRKFLSSILFSRLQASYSPTPCLALLNQWHENPSNSLAAGPQSIEDLILNEQGSLHLFGSATDFL